MNNNKLIIDQKDISKYTFKSVDGTEWPTFEDAMAYNQMLEQLEVPPKKHR